MSKKQMIWRKNLGNSLEVIFIKKDEASRRPYNNISTPLDSSINFSHNLIIHVQYFSSEYLPRPNQMLFAITLISKDLVQAKNAP